MQTERRKTIRKPAYLGGRVAFNHLYASRDCLIRNISNLGCRLSFGEAVAIPSNFVLTIPSRSQSLDARIVWRNDKEVGVAFDIPEASKPVSLDMARRLKKLEEEKRLLQMRVQELSNEV